MSGAVIENLSGRKLAVLCVALAALLLFCFLIGGLQAPAPSTSQTILASICVNSPTTADGGGDGGWYQVWSVPSQQPGCHAVETVRDLFDQAVHSDQVVFAFQMPLRRDDRLLDFSRWQQSLIGVLLVDIGYSEHHAPAPDATLTLHVRLGYKNGGDASERWQLLAESVEQRPLHCQLQTEHERRYACDLVPLFELGSLHHDYYLLNVRLPGSDAAGRPANTDIGQLEELHLVVIHANGGFTRVWLALKSVMFPLLALLLVWFWRRMRQLRRPPALVECMILWLGVTLSVLNVPLELLSLSLDLPALPLLADLRQGLFHAALLSFWLVFAGEHLVVSPRPSHASLLLYWRHLAAVAVGCLALFLFDVAERGHQLVNPFHSVWGSRLGSRLALGFIVTAGGAACVYFLFLCWMVWRVLANMSAKRQSLPAMSAVRRLHYEGIMYRFRFLMAATLVCAAMTVVGFLVGQLAEGQWKWDDQLRLQYTSAVLCGVYGMWNVYTAAVLCLYAPSHKRWPTEAAVALTALASVSAIDTTAEEVEISRLAPPPPPPAHAAAAASRSSDESSDLTSLTHFLGKPAID